MNEVNQRHPQGPTPEITPLFPQCLPQTEECEISLQIGIFFDGTGNNQDWSEPGLGMSQRAAKKDSNVARLYRAFPEKPTLGLYPLYIPGVGTPFSKIGEQITNQTTFSASKKSVPTVEHDLDSNSLTITGSIPLHMFHSINAMEVEVSYWPDRSDEFGYARLLTKEDKMDGKRKID